MEQIFVSTPKGKKFHGAIVDGYFKREVSGKDLMRIFDAWSINPAVLKVLTEKDIKGLIYTNGNDIYTISLEDAVLKGFEKEFKGGKTVYIPRKFWAVN